MPNAAHFFNIQTGSAKSDKALSRLKTHTNTKKNIPSIIRSDWRACLTFKSFIQSTQLGRTLWMNVPMAKKKYRIIIFGSNEYFPTHKAVMKSSPQPSWGETMRQWLYCGLEDSIVRVSESAFSRAAQRLVAVWWVRKPLDVQSLSYSNNDFDVNYFSYSNDVHS